MTLADPWTALADPTRRGLLAQVAREPSSVTDLARDLPISRPAVSQHLRLLLDAQLVDVRRQGKQRIYSARPEALAALRHELDTFWSLALSNFKRITDTPQQEAEQ